MKQNWWNDLLYRKIRFMVLSNFFENSKWLPAAILKMTSNLKSDSRNGLSRSKSFRKYVLVWVLLPKIAYSDIMLLFQNGGWRPSWNSKINFLGGWEPSFCPCQHFKNYKDTIDVGFNKNIRLQIFQIFFVIQYGRRQPFWKLFFYSLFE